MIKIGIVGGAGYTAGELLRILLFHPEAELVFIQSNSHAGLPVTEVHTDLEGMTALHFDKEISSDVDLIFLCSGHGRSRLFMENHTLPERIKIIDLSSDFRLKPHQENFVYGLPEANRNEIVNSKRIANPGCFATAIQLALLPLVKAGILENDVHIHAITGSTGAGQQPTSTTHFSWRNNNISIYKPFRHQHIGEIEQTLKSCQQGFEAPIHFLPVRGDFTRGIFASLYMESDIDEPTLSALYANYYENHPFVHLTAKNPALKQVVNTNKCHLFVEKHDGKILIISTIDNLIKGASGQAVQNMNLMFGLNECQGLLLKGSAF